MKMFSTAMRVTTSQVRLTSSRNISLACNQSVEKLNSILEEYRTSNYSQEYPKRFRKDVVKAACSKSTCPGLVSAEGIECILDNIGMGGKMKRSEIEAMLKEICADSNGSSEDGCAISADQMLRLIST